MQQFTVAFSDLSRFDHESRATPLFFETGGIGFDSRRLHH
jgi:hypothetical protein